MPNNLKLVSTKPSEQGRRQARRARSILVAEDDAEMRRAIVDALRKEGYAVVVASDGRELLARLVRPHPIDTIDLIVTDVQMPGCTGLELMEVLREAEWDTPMIVMTAFGDRETRERAEELGAVMLDKPFRLDVLMKAIRSSLA